MPIKSKKSNLVSDFAPNLKPSITPNSNKFQAWKNWMQAHKKILLIGSGAVVFLLVLGFSINTSVNLRHAKQELAKVQGGASPEAIAESKKIVAAVSKLVVLPEGEEPTVATVTDKSKLADQPFFDNSEEGDKVLIYTTSQRAILYRPSSNKVIEIAPLNISGGGAGDVAGQLDENPSGE